MAAEAALTPDRPQSQASIDRANLTQAVGLIQCLCVPPWGGPDCRTNICPRSVEQLVCSGFGNASVAYTSNVTSGGNGCQCAQTFSLLTPSVLSSFSVAAIEQIQDRYLASFSQTYCGVLQVLGDGIYATQPLSAACFCEKGSKGVACELNACPTLAGVVCSGRGHPALGQGLAYTTSDSRNGTCDVQCAPGLQLCNGECQLSCRHPLVCPPGAPYRCSDATCVPPAAACAAGTEYGYLDDLALARGYFVNASAATVLSSPLVFYSFTGSGALLLDGVALQGTQGVVQRTYADLEDYSPAWTVTWVAVDGLDVELFPFPFAYPAPGAAPPFSSFRLSSPSGLVIMDFVQANPYLVDFDPALAVGLPVVATFPRGVLRPGGDYVTLSVCLANALACTWAWNGSALLGPGGELCDDQSIEDTCPEVPDAASLQILNLTFTARQRTFMNDYLGRVWQLELPDTNVTFTVTAQGDVADLELVTVADLSAPCACGGAFGFVKLNQSAIDAQFAAGVGTTPVATQYAVMVERGSGQPVNVRATVLAANTVTVTGTAPGYGTLIAPLADAHFISAAQFAQGRPTCDARVFPVRCADGTCAYVESTTRTDNVTCECTGSYATNWTCACGGAACSCPGQTACACPAYTSVFGAALAAAIQDRAACTVRYDPYPFASDPSTRGAWNGSAWVAAASQLLLEVEVAGCDASAVLYADGAVYPAQVFCDGNATVLLPRGFANVSVFSLATVNQPTFFWTPAGGVPIWEVANVTARGSENSAGANSTLNVNRDTWNTTRGPSFLELDFHGPYNVTFFLVNLFTAGVAYDDGVLPIRLTLEGFDGELWRVVGTVTSAVVRGADAEFIRIAPTLLRKVRLTSPVAMGVRTFIPFAECARRPRAR